MKKLQYAGILFLALLFIGWPAFLTAGQVPPIVTSDWLEKNLSNPRLVILDIRKVEEYREGHIPGAVSAYYRTWAYSQKGKREEVPEQDDLFDAIGDAGIRPDSLVVVVCSAAYCYYDVEAARVACTLEYAGLKNVGILNGGYEEWVREKKPVSTKFVKPKKTTYRGTLKKDLLADKKYVKDHLGKAAFVDVREPAFVGKQDRIPGSANLPITEAFTKSGAFKPVSELQELAVKTVGSDKSRPIVTYCDTGRCCPTWAYIFRNVLGYKNVKIYDGGFEEWVKDKGQNTKR